MRMEKVGSTVMAESMFAALPDATKCLAPTMRFSSSMSPATVRVPRSLTPALTMALAAMTVAPRPPFMSIAPRPKSLPPSIAPPKGSTVHWLSSPRATVSVCPSTRRFGPPPLPARMPTTFGRPGSTSGVSTTSPASRRRSARRRAHSCSCGKTLGTRTSSCTSAVTFSGSIAARTRDSSGVGSMVVLLTEVAPGSSSCGVVAAPIVVRVVPAANPPPRSTALRVIRVCLPPTYCEIVDQPIALVQTGRGTSRVAWRNHSVTESRA